MRPFVLGAIAAFSLAMVGISAANADITCFKENTATGNCTVMVEIPRVPKIDSFKGVAVKSLATERACNFQGRGVACSTGAGTWVESQSSWCQVSSAQPPRSFAVWGGRTDGSIKTCTRPAFDGIPDQNMRYESWLPDAAIAAPPPDPEVLARRAIARMMLRAVDLGTFPLSVADGIRRLERLAVGGGSRAEYLGSSFDVGL